MRTALKIFLVILLILSVFLPLSAFGTEITEQFKAALEEISQELASPIAKAGLESIVFQFFRARVKFAPNKYESSDNFVSTFGRSFDSFSSLLFSVDLRLIKEKVPSDHIFRMEKSYIQHDKQFTEFSKTLPKNVPFFRQIPPSAILKSQLYFSLLLSGFNQEQWSSSRKFTHIWPFCD